MEITYLGHSSFKLRGRSAVVVTDPYNPEKTGMKFPKVAADIVTISHGHADHSWGEGVEGDPLIISGPGEYESKGIKIFGLSTYHDQSKGSERGLNTIYRIEIDGIYIVHLGDLGHKLDDKTLDALDGVNVLLIPVGGYYTISADIASEVVSQVEPDIVIPMHYRTESHKAESFAKVATLDVFLKQMGKENLAPVPKLLVTKDKLPSEMTVVVME
ncbi:MBL fold metallo-hydrolase [Patescibacteria group bacterium]|nr:MBL fold metallo-hydrolase [Patescibacteria group bacterium]MCL5797534.1 MBL fold metallo-hydrolase [Patescibacteria group bacterium]